MRKPQELINWKAKLYSEDKLPVRQKRTGNNCLTEEHETDEVRQNQHEGPQIGLQLHPFIF